MPRYVHSLFLKQTQTDTAQPWYSRYSDNNQSLAIINIYKFYNSYEPGGLIIIIILRFVSKLVISLFDISSEYFTIACLFMDKGFASLFAFF